MAKMKTEDEMKLVMDMTCGAFDDDGWKTINGTHVYIEGGSVTKGPEALRGRGGRKVNSEIERKIEKARQENRERTEAAKKAAAKKPETKKPESKEAESTKASYKKGSYEDKGVKYDIDDKGNRVAPGSDVPQVQVDISRTDGSQTFWTIRNGQRVEKTVPRSANLDKEMPKAIKALGLNMDDCYVKYS